MESDRFQRKNVYFPQLDVVFTSIDKTGSTSVKSLLMAAELVVEEGVPIEARADRILGLMPPGMMIHSMSVPQRYGLPAEIPDTAARMVILRDPIDRFLSMFINKIVDLTDPWFYIRHRKRNWQLDVDYSLAGVRRKAMALLDWIADGHFVDDAHWAPQVRFLLPDRRYDLALDTTELGSLPSRLAELRSELDWLAAVHMPVRNATDRDLPAIILTEEIEERVEELYREDLVARSELGIDRSGRPTPIGPDAEDAWTERALEIARRRERNLSRTIDTVTSTTSWRLITPLRRRALRSRRLQAILGRRNERRLRAKDA